MKITISTFFIFCTIFSKAQVNERIDSLSREICRSYDQVSGPLDSISVLKIFHQHTEKFLAKMSNEVRDIAVQKLSLRLETQCQKYSDYTRQFTSKNWKHISECPKISITEAEADVFFKVKDFWYIESSGDTTKVVLTPTSWIDQMDDGTYSKLTLKRTSPYDFRIQFIESNNSFKSSMSKKGDIYLYSVIKKNEKNYTLCVSLPQINKSSLFKLYFQFD